MATSTKNLPALARLSAENARAMLLDETRRVAKSAERSGIAEAVRWLNRERTATTEQHLQLCRVPAATFFEAQRAEWFRNQFAALGWTAQIDRAGNVLAYFRPASTTPGDDWRPVVISAHLDTVFAPQRPEDIKFGPDGRLLGPGVSDNGSGLAALLVLARALRDISELEAMAQSVLLVANVGEEGEGNLSGMRYLCRNPGQWSQVRGFLVLDGPSVDHVTTQALGSKRFEVQFQGPGGHSWNDSGMPNPVHALALAISTFTESAETRRTPGSRFSYNFGLVEGGASINSIPSSARAKLDLRAEDGALLEELSGLLNAAVERSVERENRAAHAPRPWQAPARVTARIKDLGFRPGGALPSDSPLLRTIQAVDSYLNIRSRADCASTDANVPLSLGIPAVSIGAGGQGGGAHTPQEWYSPEGRELGLQRILLIISMLVNAAQ